MKMIKDQNIISKTCLNLVFWTLRVPEIYTEVAQYEINENTAMITNTSVNIK